MADEADMAQAKMEFELDMILKQAASHSQPLPQMFNAATGDVQCWECNAVIPAERLAVVPDAILCVGCQEAAERFERLGR